MAIAPTINRVLETPAAKKLEEKCEEESKISSRYY